MKNPTLNSCTVHKTRASINRIHTLIHLTAILAILYYRTSHLFEPNVPHLIPWSLITISEVIFSFVWFLAQAFRWQPVTRSVYQENIPSEIEFPGLDVFICVADPQKEPTLEVMNSVLSAMALDYPPEKLAVYLSDDGGSPLTLYAVEEAGMFAKSWLPFCTRYGIKTRCPEAYFSTDDEQLLRSSDDEFKREENNIEMEYQLFKKKLEMAGCGGADDEVKHNRPSYIKIINDNGVDGHKGNNTKIPFLAYVSREKRPSHHHHFKAGALNALLRVSGTTSNAPYILVLDCDMYCNDPTSAKQAMCFHLDTKISPNLAFVQFPQMFYNVSRNDIYDGQGRSAYLTKWQGMDGLNGPVFSGTGYYLKRRALFESPKQQESSLSLNETDGRPNERNKVSPIEIIEASCDLASCSFEQGTQWGEEIGYSYNCLLESTFTGYQLHCKGWRSVYLYPKRPCFLGCTTVDMKDTLVQLMKWGSGSIQVGFSKFSPLTYGISRMSIPQSMCYGYIMFVPLLSVAFLLYGTVPQLCLLNGIALFPKVSDPWLGVFAFVYLSSLCQHLYEVLSSGGSARTCWNEHRIWIIKSTSGSLFGCLDALMKCWGLAKVKFRITNKAIDQEKLRKYEKGKFDFQGAKKFMIPLITLAVLNLVCFIGGIRRLIMEGEFGYVFGQLYVSVCIAILSYPILEGFIPTRGK